MQYIKEQTRVSDVLRAIEYLMDLFDSEMKLRLLFQESVNP